MKEISSKNCIYCGKQFKNNNFIVELPCGCRLCEKECFFKLVSKCLEIQSEFGYMCVCTKFYNCYNLLELLYKLNLFMIKAFDDKILSIFGVISFSFCCICSKYYNEKDEYIFISYENDKKEIKKSDFNDFVLDLKLLHFVCKPCFNKFYNNSFECKICNFKHKNLGKNKENINITEEEEKNKKFKDFYNYDNNYNNNYNNKSYNHKHNHIHIHNPSHNQCFYNHNHNHNHIHNQSYNYNNNYNNGNSNFIRYLRNIYYRFQNYINHP